LWFSFLNVGSRILAAKNRKKNFAGADTGNGEGTLDCGEDRRFEGGADFLLPAISFPAGMNSDSLDIGTDF
jgi:hypothetical protein